MLSLIRKSIADKLYWINPLFSFIIVRFFYKNNWVAFQNVPRTNKLMLYSHWTWQKKRIRKNKSLKMCFLRIEINRKSFCLYFSASYVQLFLEIMASCQSLLHLLPRIKNGSLILILCSQPVAIVFLGKLNC